MTIIGCRDWNTLAGQSWGRGSPAPSSGVIFVDIDSIPDFFKTISGNKEKYVVISAGSDYGLHLQKQNPVWLDSERACGLFARPSDKYEDIGIEARCNRERCNITDKYSIKCYSYTNATFDVIPPQIQRWYLTNNEISDPRLVTIPFGVNDIAQEVNCKDILSRANKTNTNRPIRVFCSWQFCTKERLELWQYFEKLSVNDPGIVCKYGMPFEQYVEYLCNSQYCVCPPGNGLQSFREYEAITCNTIPLTSQDVDYGIMPVLQLSSLYHSSLLPIRTNYSDISNATCSLEYWQKEIEKSRELLA